MTPKGGGPAIDDKHAHARLTVSRLAAALFWERGVAKTSGDDIAAAAGLSTRTIWRYFRTKESCVEPLLATSADRFVEILRRWPPDALPISPSATCASTSSRRSSCWSGVCWWMRIATMTASEPALRTAYLMVHDRMEQGFIPVVARRLHLDETDLAVRLCAAAVTGAFRVVDETVSRAVIVDGEAVDQKTTLALIDRAIREATNGRLGGPVSH